ncbi:MAG: hypothetical protein LBK53_03645 [Heliobacteriaceae bacterium]|jgi:tetratricopeptide (TPR) repeat protein|nr:hypothetical protein [Heliobacteriaceae bacterium]
MGLNLSNIQQRPYINVRPQIKKKEDEEQSASRTHREEQANQDSRSKGLQYIEERTPSAPPGFQPVAFKNAQIRAADASESLAVNKKNSTINIAQILKDFRNTAAAIGTPDDLKDEVNGYLSLIEKQVSKGDPNVRLIKSNLKNASTILDKYISETLNKESKVVENWVDALFLQQIDFKYDESSINPQFLVKFPEGSTEQPVKEAQPKNESLPENPQENPLKSLFTGAKKLAKADRPKEAILAFREALAQAQEAGDIDMESKIFFEVGKIYDDHDYFTQALISYNKSVEMTNDVNVKTKAHFSMAQIYDDTNYITPAIEHYFNSISFGGEAENFTAQSTALVKIGNIYTDMFEDARDYYGIAQELADQTDNSKVKGYISSSFAGAHEKFGEPQEALKSYSKAIRHYTEAKSPDKAAENYISASDIMLGYNNVEKAKSLLNKALSFAGNDSALTAKIKEKISRI